MTRFSIVCAAAGSPAAAFTLWQLGPTGAAPLTLPWLAYSLLVIYLHFTPGGSNELAHRSNDHRCELQPGGDAGRDRLGGTQVGHL